jgi:hypothetical protein
VAGLGAIWSILRIWLSAAKACVAAVSGGLARQPEKVTPLVIRPLTAFWTRRVLEGRATEWRTIPVLAPNRPHGTNRATASAFTGCDEVRVQRFGALLPGDRWSWRAHCPKKSFRQVAKGESLYSGTRAQFIVAAKL